jgi:hypothetical protein
MELALRALAADELHLLLLGSPPYHIPLSKDQKGTTNTTLLFNRELIPLANHLGQEDWTKAMTLSLLTMIASKKYCVVNLFAASEVIGITAALVAVPSAYHSFPFTPDYSELTAPLLANLHENRDALTSDTRWDEPEYGYPPGAYTLIKHRLSNIDRLRTIGIDIKPEDLD